MRDPTAAELVLSAANATPDIDPQETAEWLESFDAILDCQGKERAQYVFDRLSDHVLTRGVSCNRSRNTPYRNSIPLEQQQPYPGDLELEARLMAAIRWNALAMVVRANKFAAELGGHIASYASAADLFEVGFNHFFKAAGHPEGADLVFFQAHSAPGIYARAYLEGFLNQSQLEHYRQEVDGGGLCSYPHPWLMPEFWQFPTGSMGIGPINAILHARFMRYLQARGILATDSRRVWGFFGDGEMDEPESVGALSLAARERLDNVTFVINCNLQRLDGPVRGNSRIIDELEALFTGAGWNVIKVLWGSEWDALFARDTRGVLLRAFAKTVDGQFQTFSANDGAYNRARFFAQSPHLAALVANMSDAEIDRLRRGGHDVRKLYAAYAAAIAHKGQPTVILAKTMKGYGMGSAGQGRMTTHQQKKLERDSLIGFRDRLRLPMSDEQVERLEFYSPAADSAELAYLRTHREALGGCLPRRRSKSSEMLTAPTAENFAAFALHANGKDMSTTMAVVRMLTMLLKDAHIGNRIVPIVADEARTFGMAPLFKQIGIYSPLGQLYESEDQASMLAYRESGSGQMLEEGISEAAAISSWIAAATSYSVHDRPMLPFYIYYSMFGFQRIGDLIWAAADQRARGFLLGATAGRTTLGGEGLQHQDGGSHVQFATIPNCRAYDPAFAYESAVIIERGIQEMLQEQRDCFYYLTVTNANYPQPSLPAGAAVRAGILKGLYPLVGAEVSQVQLLGSGAIMTEVLAARDGIDCERRARLQQSDETERPFVTRTLGVAQGPVIAASDYVRALPELIRAFVPQPFVTLGTDGFGRSDTRSALRRFFEVDAISIVIAALSALAETGSLGRATVRNAISRYGREAQTLAPWCR